MKTHFDPYPQHDEFGEQAACGTWVGENSGLTGDWSCVDCRRCLGRKEKISAAVVAEENAIVEQMGHMAAFMQEQH